MLAFQGINLNSEMRGDIQQMSPDEKLYVDEIFKYQYTCMILEKPLIYRNGFDIQQLQKLTSNVLFFKEVYSG